MSATASFLRPTATLVSPSRPVSAILLVLLATLALAISAKLQVPFYPVPITMQTYVVLFIGFAFGARLAAITLLTYLLEGALGFPVFAQSGGQTAGILYLLGPTGGYLAGFVLAAVVCGWCAERHWDRTPLGTAAAALIGLVIIFACGLGWLGSVAGWDKPILAWGLVPFLPGEVFKLGLLSATMPLAWRIRNKIAGG
ncbi:MAG: biotin transporter BioY [Proteobacteria bacterium]|nr:biotin transporter BioY [Pseudomonadota bacterium]